MKPDIDLAIRLQMEEAVAASLYPNPSSSSRKQPPTTFGDPFKLRKVKKERMDRINDDKFAQPSSQISDTDWELSGDQVRMPSDEGLVNYETCRVGINADSTYQSVELICSEPRVSVYPNFLSKEECEHLIDLAKPHMQRCLVRDGETGKYSIDDSRTSSGAYVKRGQDKIIMDIENRIAEWTSIPASHGENLYVLHYKVGQKFESHYDYFIDEVNTQNGGQRIATVLMYLSNVKEGGETIFPIAKWSKGAGPYWDKLPTYGKKGLLVKPKMGDAVLLWNVKPNGDVDPLTYHGGCPVIQGNKWACTKFLRVNEFRVWIFKLSFVGAIKDSLFMKDFGALRVEYEINVIGSDKVCSLAVGFNRISVSMKVLRCRVFSRNSSRRGVNQGMEDGKSQKGDISLMPFTRSSAPQGITRESQYLDERLGA